MSDDPDEARRLDDVAKALAAAATTAADLLRTLRDLGVEPDDLVRLRRCTRRRCSRRGRGRIDRR